MNPSSPRSSSWWKDWGSPETSFGKWSGIWCGAGILERIQGKGTFIVTPRHSITFSNWVSAELSPKRYLDLVADRYTKTKNEAVIENLSIPFYQYPAKLLDLILNDRAPDVIQVNPFSTQTV